MYTDNQLFIYISIITFFITISISYICSFIIIGHKLRCQKVTFRSNILGTTFSLWFQVIKGLTNTMLKVLHHIPCSFLSGCLQTFKNSTKITHLKRGVYYYISKSMTPKLVIPGINGISWISTSFMKNLDLQHGLSCFNMKFHNKGRFYLLSFATFY